MESSSQRIDEVVIPACPICAGRLEVVYERSHQHVANCIDCHTTVTIPGRAWAVRYRKQQRNEGFGKTG
jgi:hypothetical protein